MCHFNFARTYCFHFAVAFLDFFLRFLNFFPLPVFVLSSSAPGYLHSWAAEAGVVGLLVLVNLVRRLRIPL